MIQGFLGTYFISSYWNKYKWVWNKFEKFFQTYNEFRINLGMTLFCFAK